MRAPILTTIACCLPLCLAQALPAQQTFYVSTVGNDADPGTLAQPWATLDGARQNIRPHLDGSGDITVRFRGGTYVLDQTVVFGLSDDGTATQKITYAAFPGEIPIFSSLVRVTGWTSHDGNIMKANLPAGISHVRYLQDASEAWMPRSATPQFNPTALQSEENNEVRMYDPAGQPGKSFINYPNSWSAPTWSFATQYDLRVSAAPWLLNVLPIASVNAGPRRIQLASPSTYEMRTEAPIATTEAWVLNTLEGIDTAGEWASLNGQIFLFPRSGTGDIFVPRLTELVRVDDGTVDGNAAITTPVQHLHFEDLTFTGADYLVTGPPPGAVTAQHDWGLIDAPASLLRFRNAAHSSVTNCRFVKSGSGGVRLDRYAQNITIDRNEFSNLGREGVMLGGRGPGYGNVNKNNEIAHNHIATPGREKWDSPAINLSQSSNNRIHHNYIEDTYQSAIHLTSSRSVYLGFKAYENADSYFVGRESHYWEVHPDVVQFILDNEDTLGFTASKVEAQMFFYNDSNRVEQNVLRDLHDSQFFANPISMTNGMIYISGTTRNRTQWLQQNYLYDSDPTNNTQLLYADSYQDDLEVIQNMVSGVEIGDDIGDENHPIWDFNGFYEDGLNYGGRGLYRANVIQASSFSDYFAGLGGHWIEEGNLDFTQANAGGAAANVSDYQEMFLLLCPGVLPGPVPLVGADTMQTNLAAKITSFGAAVPVCPGIFADGFESGDTSAWQ